jgi:hypothetical protein
MEKITDFFMWCSIINASFLIFVFVMMISIPDTIYSIHAKMFSISREKFIEIIYSIGMLYKILFLFFNLVPYLVLLMIK